MHSTAVAAFVPGAHSIAAGVASGSAARTAVGAAPDPAARTAAGAADLEGRTAVGAVVAGLVADNRSGLS